MAIFKSVSPTQSSPNTHISKKNNSTPSGNIYQQVAQLVSRNHANQFNEERFDFHDYSTPPLEVCDTREPNCTKEKVFEELISDNTFSRPIASDFYNLNKNMFKNATNDVLTWLGAPEYFRLNLQRITNQTEAITYSAQREELSRSRVGNTKTVPLYAQSNE